MRFSIDKRQENKLDLVCLTDSQTGTEASVIPAFGVILHTFSIRVDGQLLNVIDNYTGFDQLQALLANSFKGSKLSPFPCRIPEGKYSFNGKEYEFRTKFMDGSAIHGLLYNKAFELLSAKASESGASLLFQYEYNQDDPGYPHCYRCQVEYELQEDSLLLVRTTLYNTGKTVIPIADGWHPYFKLGGKIDDWLLYFEAESMVEFDNKLIPTGRLVSYDKYNKPLRIGYDQMDNCFLIKNNREGPSCQIRNPENNLTLSFFPDANYPYLQLYTAPDRYSIAIENLSAAPDCFNNKMGLTLLYPGLSQSFTVFYQIRAV
jgi:aldose 1-epimerase